MNEVTLFIVGFIVGPSMLAIPVFDFVKRTAWMLGAPSSKSLLRTIAATYRADRVFELAGLSRRCARALRDCQLTLSSGRSYAASRVEVRISAAAMRAVAEQLSPAVFAADLAVFYSKLAQERGWIALPQTDVVVNTDLSLSVNQVLVRPVFQHQMQIIRRPQAEASTGGEDTTRSFSDDTTSDLSGIGSPLSDPGRCTLTMRTASGRQVFDALHAPVHIGRLSTNEMVLDVPGVSRMHARFTHDSATGWMLEALPTPNGTKLDGQPVARSAALSGRHSVNLGHKASLDVESVCACAPVSHDSVWR